MYKVAASAMSLPNYMLVHVQLQLSAARAQTKTS